MTLLQPLPWDSDFFGLAIAQWVGEDFPKVQSDVLLEARLRNFGCVYVKVPLSEGQPPEQSRVDLRLVDIKVVLARSLPGQEAKPVVPLSPNIRLGSLSDLPALQSGLAELAIWSRFASDPRFGLAAAARMYERWSEHACMEDDQMLLIAEDEAGIAGFLALGLAPADIGLIFAGRSRTGVGTALAQRAFAEAAGRSPEMTVATQERNAPALHFYQKLGFGIRSRTAVYHLWLDEVQ